MNDQLQQALLAVLQSTVDAATAAKNFLVAEVPDVIHQLLVWKALQSGIWFSISMLFLAIALWSIFRAWRRFVIEEMDPAMGYAILGVLTGVTALCCLDLAWLQILVAPKIYLIEYAAHLARSMK